MRNGAPRYIEGVEPFDTLSFLLGTWTVDRVIEDHRQGSSGRFSGKSELYVVEPVQSHQATVVAAYEEYGELKFGEHIVDARRRLEFHRVDGRRVALMFSDGRLFVDLDLSSGAWESLHHCGRDTYRISTVMRSSDVVEERWRVSGPNKDYDAVTRYAREC